MRAPEPLIGSRVVAGPEILDGITAPEGQMALRIATDELFVLGTFKLIGPEPMLQEDEPGYVGWWLTSDELTDLVLPHVEWPLPAARPALVQGLVAGVPAKIWLTQDRALLLCAAAYAHELAERLG